MGKGRGPEKGRDFKKWYNSPYWSKGKDKKQKKDKR